MSSGRLSVLVKEYGRLAAGVHTVNSAVFYSSALAAVHFGMDVSEVLPAPLLPNVLPPPSYCCRLCCYWLFPTVRSRT